MSRVRVTIVTVEKQEVLNILAVSVFLPWFTDVHSACALLVSWFLSSSTIFFFIVCNKRHVFSKNKLLSIKMYVLVSPQICLKYFFIPRRIQRDSIMNVNRYSCKVPFIRARL